MIIGAIAFFYLQSIDLRQFAGCFFPVSNQTYWFISAYVELYLLAPFLNIVVDHIGRKQFLCLILVLLFSANILTSQEIIFHRSNTILMSLLYLTGRYLAIYKSGMLASNKKCLALMALFMTMCVPVVFSGYGAFFFRHTWDHVYQYHGIGLIFLSILIFYFFKNIHLQNKIINNFAKSTLAIYLIHENHLVSNLIYERPAQMLSDKIGGGSVLIISALAVMFLCLLIDRPRIWLFKLFQPTFEKLSEWLQRMAVSLYESMIRISEKNK